MEMTTSDHLLPSGFVLDASVEANQVFSLAGKILVTILSLLFVSCIVLRFVIRLSLGKYRIHHHLSGKIYIITGANTGIGLATAKALAQAGGQVILACRDISKAEAAIKQILLENPNSSVKAYSLDLCSFASIRRFADEIKQNEPRIDCLVNNAAIIPHRMDIFTEDGFEAAYQTNYLGPVLLTMLLLDVLQRTPHSRIVNVSSNLHHVGNVNDFIQKIRGQSVALNPLVVYANTKMALMMFTRELAHLVRPSGTVVNTVHPGPTKTNIAFQGSTSLTLLFTFIFSCFGKTTDEASQAVLYAVESPEAGKTSGNYFVDCQQGWINWRVFNKTVSRKLWNDTMKALDLPGYVGLREKNG